MAAHNPDALCPLSVYSEVFRGRFIRSHNHVYHTFPGECPVLHLPVEIDGVVP